MTEKKALERFYSLHLGVSDAPIELQTPQETRHAIDLIVSQANLGIEIFSRNLDADFYDRKSFLEAVSSFCRGNANARLRILVQNPAEVTQHSHRLIELSRKLSSSIELRQPHEDYRSYNEAFLLADKTGFVHRDLADHYEGKANFCDPTTTKRLFAYFTEVWERSEPHPEFRRLNL